MKRVIVVSDSHGMEERLQEILLRAFSAGPVDVIVFLGDGLSEWERVSQEFLYGRPSLRLYAVKGNNDFGWDAPVCQVISVGKAKLLLCHGHTFHVKNGLYHLEFEAADQEVQAALFGHTHLGHLEYANGCLFLNPVAVCNYGSSSPVYAEVLISDDGAVRGQLHREAESPAGRSSF